jgi:spermidine/putrescine transport system ATP-binding protein
VQEQGTQGAAAIRASGVSKHFGTGPDAVTALDNVSLDVRENEFFTLLGPSGCGKTTLLRLIAGFEEPSSGYIELHGKRLTGLPPYQRPVNTVFQNYALFPHLNVARNVSFGLEMLGTSSDETAKRVAQMLDLVRLSQFQNRKPAQLSGGQQQRVALARALANHPRVLLLDEPLSALDLKLRKEMQLELKRLQSETGITFIFVTHDQEEALTMSDRVAVMKDGGVLQVGTPSEIYEHPATRFVADFIGDTNFLAAVRGNNGSFKINGIAQALDADGIGIGGESDEITLAIRPERVSFVEGDFRGDGITLTGRIENIVYFGTDTIYHLRLNQGEKFRIRTQNHTGAKLNLAVNSDVRIHVPRDAVRVLTD